MIVITLLLVGFCMAVAGVLSLLFVRNSRAATLDEDERKAINVAVAEDNREMLTRGLDESDAAEGEEEVDAALLADVDDAPPKATRETKRWLLLVVAASIPLLALLLYWMLWGRPGTVLLEDVAELMQRGFAEETSNEILERLNSYVEMHPADPKAWVSLMSFQWYTGDREAFRESHRAAEQAGHTSPYGDSLYLLDAFRQRQLNLSPRDELVRERLRDINSDSQVVALLDAFDHTAKGDLVAANKAWETILSQPDLFELHSTAELGQRATRARLEADTHPKIVVDISLESPQPNMRWLFVYAVKEMDQPPLAVVKRPFVNQRRIEVVLDDSVAMRPELHLSAVGPVLVVARLSETADALEQANDLRVVSERVAANERERVALTFGNAVPLVTVQLATEHAISPYESVFIIVKKRTVSVPPLAVRRIYGLPSPNSTTVTLADAMMPINTSTGYDDLVVKARVSRTGSATARPGDIESSEVPFDVGGNVVLKLDQVLN